MLLIDLAYLKGNYKQNYVSIFFTFTNFSHFDITMLLSNMLYVKDKIKLASALHYQVKQSYCGKMNLKERVMKGFKKLLGASALVLASVGANAADINVGGVVWDPAHGSDFSAQYDFTQWYSTTNATDAASIASSADSATLITTVLGSLDGSTNSTGYFLSGVGEFYRINNPLTDFCPGCELTFAFGGIELLGDSTFDISSSWLNIYVDDTPDFIAGSDVTTGAEAGLAFSDTDPSPWLSLSFASFGLQNAATVGGGSAESNLLVTGGLAAPNFLDSQAQGLIFNLGSAFFFDTQFQNGGLVQVPLSHSVLGNGQLISDTIPEPASLAVFGLGLLGLAGAARRKKA